MEIRNRKFESYHRFSHNTISQVIAGVLRIDTINVDVYYMHTMHEGLIIYFEINNFRLTQSDGKGEVEGNGDSNSRRNKQRESIADRKLFDKVLQLQTKSIQNASNVIKNRKGGHLRADLDGYGNNESSVQPGSTIRSVSISSVDMEDDDEDNPDWAPGASPPGAGAPGAPGAARKEESLDIQFRDDIAKALGLDVDDLAVVILDVKEGGSDMEYDKGQKVISVKKIKPESDDKLKTLTNEETHAISTDTHSPIGTSSAATVGMPTYVAPEQQSQSPHGQSPPLPPPVTPPAPAAFSNGAISGAGIGTAGIVANPMVVNMNQMNNLNMNMGMGMNMNIGMNMNMNMNMNGVNGMNVAPYSMMNMANMQNMQNMPNMQNMQNYNYQQMEQQLIQMQQQFVQLQQQQQKQQQQQEQQGQAGRPVRDGQASNETKTGTTRDSVASTVTVATTGATTQTDGENVTH